LLATVYGVQVPPEGNLLDTATFDAAVGLFMLTVSALAPGVAWTPKGQKRWVRVLVVFTLYGYGIETLQAFRGLDPRFSRVAGPTDQIAGGIFFLTALGIFICFAVLAFKYWRASSTPVVVAIRYGTLASAIGYGVGIWMSLVTQGRVVPENGNLLVVHAFGFHGLQAIPIVALLLHWSKAPLTANWTIVHLSGLTWLGACAALAWQSASGYAMLDWTPAAVIAALSLAIFAFTALIAARTWLRAKLIATP
jgi:hypothetical protein